VGDPAFTATGFRRFYDRVRRQGLEWMGLYYGLYRAEVVSNEGPEDKPGRGIITVRVAAIGDTPTTAPRVAYPKVGFAGKDYGQKYLPPSGDFVWVEFEGGRPDTPVWTGGWWADGEMPEEMRNTTRHGVKTPGGHSVLFSDDPDNRFVRITWHSDDGGDDEFAFIELTKDGGIAMSNKNGSSVFLSAADKSVLAVSEQGHSMSMTEDAVSMADKDGNIISIDKGAVTVLSAGDVNVRAPSVNIGAGSVFLGDQAVFSAVLGEQLIAWLATHIHSTAIGPTSPALTIPLLQTIISKLVKLRQ
jgi:hypothetical protein